MPALPNPRHERFAQLFFAGLSDGITQHEAYIAAGYSPSNKAHAKSSASRLMSTIVNRVRELQQEQQQRLQPKLDISRERVGRNLDEASRMAKHAGDARGIVSAELGLAKVFGLDEELTSDKPNWSSTQSMHDIGKQLLEGMGLHDPDDDSIRQAIEANDQFIARLEQIAQEAQGLTIDQTSVDGCQPRLASMKKRRRRL
jgi:hypothetical protein